MSQTVTPKAARIEDAGSAAPVPTDILAADPAAGNGIGPQTAVRFAVIQAHRIFQRRFIIPGLNRFSTVLVSLTEVAAGPDGGLNIPFIGAATMKLYNVAPRDDGTVDVRGEIDWGVDINVKVSFFVA